MLGKKKQDNQNIHKGFDSTQKYLEIDHIQDDMLFLKDKSLRAVILVSGMNIELKSTEEQNTSVAAYQETINSIEFPIQILVQSRRVDLTAYLESLRESIWKQTVPLLREQTEEYVRFLEDILASVNVMDKRFYVIIPYFPNVVAENSKGIMSFFGVKNQKTNEAVRLESLALSQKQLSERTDVVASLFSSFGLTVSKLPTKSLIELFYTCYNPETAEHEHIKHLDELGSNYISRRENTESSIAE